MAREKETVKTSYDQKAKTQPKNRDGNEKKERKNRTQVLKD